LIHLQPFRLNHIRMQLPRLPGGSYIVVVSLPF
jgi:hypothetical protein